MFYAQSTSADISGRIERPATAQMNHVQSEIKVTVGFGLVNCEGHKTLSTLRPQRLEETLEAS